MGLVFELRRRNVLRMAALYVVAAWLIMQVAEVVIGLADLPQWLGFATLVLLAVGFPIALILSWFYQITPEGIAREQDVEPAEASPRTTHRRLEIVFVSLLSAAVILFAYDKWWTGGSPDKSIAVLAFENMSGDPGQEYFSDGISEELLNLLSKMPELRVISRTSAFSFKDKNVDVPTIAEQLNVSHVLEGSVRVSGDKVRITAQLIDARSDAHLWSETYDQTLNDIFAVQHEIASTVVDELKVKLLGELPQVQQVDPEAYALLLQAQFLERNGTVDAIDRANALYTQLLEIEPEYTPAWVGLSVNYSNLATKGVLPFDEGFDLARDAAQKAIALDEDNAGAYAHLGWIAMWHDHDLAIAAKHYERALALDPTNIGIIANSAILLKGLGRLDEAVTLMEFHAARDPVNPTAHYNLGLAYLAASRWEEAIESQETALRLSPDYVGAHSFIGTALLMLGEPESALERMREEPSEPYRLLGTAMALHALGRGSESDQVLAELIDKYEQYWAYNIAYVLAFRNDADDAFAWLEKAVDYGDPGLADIVAEVLFRRLQLDPRWATFLGKIGKSPSQLAAVEFDVSMPD